MTPFEISARWKDQIPAFTAHLLELHVNRGPEALSSFSFRLLSGDAFGAACIADGENRDAMGALLEIIATDFPGDCYGSREAVEQWPGLKHTPPFTVPDSWTATALELRYEGPQYGEPETEEKSASRTLH